MSGNELTALSIADLQSLLRRREVSPRELLDALRTRIEAVDGDLGAYVSFDVEAAIKEAEHANVDLPLGGVPIAIKDIINVMHQPCTCASKILNGYRAPYDATVIQKLRAAGAIPFGKTNLDEFAMGSSTENSALKSTRNPWDLSRVPGGSSGGSAAAVAADEAFGALGSDTGGSIRQPAALCGVVGLKPSYGRVSRFGLVAFASSLDQVGPVTNTVRDSALIMNAIAGHDPQDSTSLKDPVPDYVASLGNDLRGVRLGVPTEYMIEGIDSQVRVESTPQSDSSIPSERTLLKSRCPTLNTRSPFITSLPPQKLPRTSLASTACVTGVVLKILKTCSIFTAARARKVSGRK